MPDFSRDIVGKVGSDITAYRWSKEGCYSKEELVQIVYWAIIPLLEEEGIPLDIACSGVIFCSLWIYLARGKSKIPSHEALSIVLGVIENSDLLYIDADSIVRLRRP